MTDLDAETRDCIRDLCQAVAELATLSVHLTGTIAAGGVIDRALRLSQRMDTLDENEAKP